MQTHLLSRADKMVLGLAVWLCTLPLAFAIAFFFGLQAGFATALGLLFVVTALCWGLCSSQSLLKHFRQQQR